MAASLPLLPPQGLDNSILLAVLVGLLILAFFTEAFGWVFAGLVVPGYLASVFVIQPEAGATVVFESVVTYALSWVLAKQVSRTGAWTQFFGRERFLLIVLVSVLVRAVDELWLLPFAARHLDEALGTSFVASRSLFSIGLVLVPLTTNAFWKLNLPRGLFQVGVPVALTYAVLRFVLLPHTNLSFGAFALTYEDIALRFLASPKAYVILLTAAWLGAHFNLRFGWDYNGILVPALLAVAWFEPLKIATTVAEVLVLVGATSLLLKVPGIGTLNLEGPRKTVLVFSVGFLVKYLLGWALGGHVPGLKVTDLFGFGYLVPTLLAVKILQKKATARVLFPALQTSVGGLVLGSFVGFGLHLVEPARPFAAAVDSAPQRSALLGTPLGAMGVAHVKARQRSSPRAPLEQSAQNLVRYSELWRELSAWLHEDGQPPPASALAQAQALGLSITKLDSTVGGRLAWALHEEEERLDRQRGWDTAVLVPGAPGPVLEVPRPWSEPPAAEAAVVLCERLSCRAMLASGVDSHQVGLRAGDAVAQERTPFRVAHRRLVDETIVQLRADAAVSPEVPTLHVSQGLPPIDVRTLWHGEVSVSWEPAPGTGRQWQQEPLAVLRVHPEALLALVADEVTQPQPRPQVSLAAWLEAALDGQQARALSQTITPAPSDIELRFFEELVVEPLAEAASSPDAGLRAVRFGWAARLASLLGIEAQQLPDCAGAGRGCWLFAASHASPWPMLAVRPGSAQAVVEVPNALRGGGTARLAAELWMALDGQLLVAAWNDLPQNDGDDARPAATPVHAAHQAVHRVFRQHDGLVLQVRTFAPRPELPDDLVLSVGRPLSSLAEAPPALRRPFETGPLAGLARRIRLYDAGLALAGLKEGGPQLAYSDAVGGATTAVLWVSDRVRDSYAALERAHLQSDFAQAGLQLTDAELEEAFVAGPLLAPAGAPSAQIASAFEPLAQLAERYQTQRNIHDLRRLQAAAKGSKGAVRVQAGWCPSRAAPYLVMEAERKGEVLRGLFFLEEPVVAPERVQLAAGDGALGQRVAQGVLARGRIVLHGRRAAAGSVGP